jgi:hypothetical protein
MYKMRIFEFMNERNEEKKKIVKMDRNPNNTLNE